MQKLACALLTVAILAWAPTAFAQGSASASITAQATVLTGVTVTGQRDLDFGNVVPGTNKSIPITAATSGRWLVQGSSGAEVSVTFPVLPISLSDGANALAIVYSATDAGHNTSNDPGTATTFDPNSGTTANIGNLPADLYVWIGGQVVPSGGQPAGLYQGTITMQATYTGN